jgi:hypothetical protein
MIVTPPAEPIAGTRRHFLELLVAGSPTLLLGNSLSRINRIPQGSGWNDSFSYTDNCTPSFPFWFDIFIPSNILQLNAALLSFKLRAFRTYNDFSVNGTGAGSAHGHGGHSHGQESASNPTSVVSSHSHQYNDPGTTGSTTTDSSSPANESSHTHGISSSSTVGIFESTVASGVKVSVNGTDRTSALGGGTGFNSDQSELALTVAWLNLGAWNLVTLTPTSALGRIVGHLRLTAYSQSV